MTESDQRIYDRLSEAARRAVDACSESLKPIVLRTWANREFDKPKAHLPPGYVPWDQRPRRETVAPKDASFTDPTEERERYP